MILQRHALSSMTQSQRDVVESVLDRPDHVLHIDAVETLQFGFDGAWVSQQLIAALAHASSAVRAAAAELLVWEEPVAGTAPLIAATRDPDQRVVESAFNTLCYYPTQATIVAAHALIEHADEGIRDSARNCLRWVREEFLAALAHPEHQDFIRAWAAPVWPMLAIHEQHIANDAQRVGRLDSVSY